MTHIQQRRDQAAVWAAENPILMEGESGHETDTGREKLGDGTSTWNDLPYKFGVDSVAGRTGEIELTVADIEGAAPVESPDFTGNPTAPTRAVTDSSKSIATTAYVKAQFTDTDLKGYPTAPTPPLGDNDVSVATTAFVKGQFTDTSLQGNPTAPTPPATDNDTSIATTAWVKALDLKPLGRYDNNISMIPFGGFPANNTRYALTPWTVAIPAGAQYVSVHLTCEAYANGPGEVTWWMEAAIDAGAYSDMMTSVHTNGAVPSINMPANLMTNIAIPNGATSIKVRLAGRSSAGSGYAAANLFMANAHLTFMGF